MIRQNQSLLNYNTFHIDAVASSFVEVTDYRDLISLRNSEPFDNYSWLVMGGGSNILFTQNPDVPVVKVAIPGISVATSPSNSDDIMVTDGAGVNWHDLVVWSLANGYFGLENLSLIPGLVGAAPMQNIGAYGIELTDVFDSLIAFDIASGELKTFSHDDCNFGYRSSVFKTELKGRYVIVSVTMRLSTKPNLKLEYGDIRAKLAEQNIENPTPLDVSNTIVAIRQSKLPDPAVIGNAGSFFKNPEIGTDHFETLKSAYPTIPGYLTTPGKIKVPAGWLIDQLGWKGFRDGDAGVHAKQALVLVNHGSATGHQIYALAKKVQHQVYQSYQIMLEPEVNII
ncbi:MAG: UDP-N-acetylmuramate dehydrogenase [Balneolales bacterium]|nr:UDP-N-acetylmuramate dehydrogenase [Balneolales bacterium]